MGFLLKTCTTCGTDKANNGFFSTKSPFYKDGVLNVCKDCVSKMLKEHPNDLNFANKLCQWADIPFNPTEWIQLYETNKENTFYDYIDASVFL